jgi:hypothetical protein
MKIRVLLAKLVLGRDEEESHCKAFLFFMTHVYKLS